jgi:hypothetical protein
MLNNKKRSTVISLAERSQLWLNYSNFCANKNIILVQILLTIRSKYSSIFMHKYHGFSDLLEV